MKKSLGLVFSGLLCASALGAKDDKKTPPKSSLQGFLQQYAYYPVPFEYNEYEPFMLKGTINGKGIMLMVDTGAPLTALDPRRTAGLKTLKELHTKISDALLGTIDEPDALLVPSITIAQARFVNQPAMANSLDVEYQSTPWNGILGLDFLKRNFCIIDCGGLTIYFRGSKPTTDQANAIAETFRKSGFTAVPIHGRHRLEVSASLTGKPLLWAVDTGASFTVLSEETRSNLKIPIMRADTSESFLPTALSAALEDYPKAVWARTKYTLWKFKTSLSSTATGGESTSPATIWSSPMGKNWRKMIKSTGCWGLICCCATAP